MALLLARLRFVVTPAPRCVPQVETAMQHVRARHGAPWCVHASFFKPHPPWLAAAPFNTQYTPEVS